MNKILLILAMSMVTVSMVNHVYAAPTNSVAITASCKNNAMKKSWCGQNTEQSQKQNQNPIQRPIQTSTPLYKSEQNSELNSKSHPKPIPEPYSKPDSESELDLESNTESHAEPQIIETRTVDLPIKKMTAAEIATLDKEKIFQLSSAEIATISAKTMFSFNSKQLKFFLTHLTEEAIKGFSFEQLAALNINAMAAFSTEMITKLAPEAVRGFSTEHLLSLKPDVLLGLTVQQRQNLAITQDLPAFLHRETNTNPVNEPSQSNNIDQLEEIHESKSIDKPKPSDTVNLDNTYPNNVSESNNIDNKVSTDKETNANKDSHTKLEETSKPAEVDIQDEKQIAKDEESVIPNGMIEPTYLVNDAILLLPEVQIEVFGEILSYEVKMESDKHSNYMKVTMAKPIKPRINQEVVVSTFLLDSSELIVPSLQVADSVDTMALFKVILQAVTFEPLVFRVVDVFMLPDKTIQ